MINRTRPRGRSPALGGLTAGVGSLSKQVVIALLLVVALFSFEIFNFDTTEFALESLLGGAAFAGIKWATVLAIAFCAIDFAGLARIFTPAQGADEPKEIWYLTAAWLMGATMNAVMTWWAVSITLLGYDIGNEILSRDQILTYVPIFVAVLVWLTRIMFIGAMSVAGEQLLWGNQQAKAQPQIAPRPQPVVWQQARIRPSDPRKKPYQKPMATRTTSAPPWAPEMGNREERPIMADSSRSISPRTQYRQMDIS